MKQLTPSVSSFDHVLRYANAPIELVEYGDYECPFCGRAYPIVKDIVEQFGRDIKFVFRNFPLSKIHPHAFMAAVATEAAGMQGKFWEMHDIIFEHQRNLDAENIFLLAEKIGLDPDRFKQDMHLQELIDKVESDFESGLRSGVNRTPTFFINGEKFNGEWSEGGLLEALKQKLLHQEIY
ncbi:MAG: DsbA family protein [Chitinophagaceae bacterium]|nr:DsbA family protein [Chitinophagaceae bacterium]